MSAKDEDIGCFVMIVLVCVALIISYVAAHNNGREKERKEWHQCRALLVSSDSSSVLNARPECNKWTWPQKMEKEE